ncbi:MAG: hypothetical protein JKY37_25490 [Nannocystaceae bacterium]|nr:hypothetical protein [Nannocystaceae bacterium]
MSAICGYWAGMSVAQAADARLGVAHVLTREGRAVDDFAREMLFSGFALVDGVVRLGGSLGFSQAFRFGTHHADGAACASVQGIGFAVLGVSALLVIAIGRMRMVSERRRLDLARHLIERGLAPPAGLVVAPARRDLRRGVVALCTGIGVCAAGLVLGDRGLGAGGLIPAFIGVGYLLSYRLALGEALDEEDGLAAGLGDHMRTQDDPFTSDAAPEVGWDDTATGDGRPPAGARLPAGRGSRRAPR